MNHDRTYNEDMVDESLPYKDRPLRYLFLDLNSYFASVEQQEQPELRGKPTAVVPVMADTSFVIAASYEAKAFGVKTGTRIGDAKAMCPELTLVHARPPLYAAYHKRCIEVAEGVLPVEEVCSIDEMRFRLLGDERDPEEARKLGLKMKEAIWERVGRCMNCSIGIATNGFLAKLGTELEKPNGLVIIEARDLPHKLHTLKLTDFTGINKRMQVRLNAAGIFTAEQLCAASKGELHRGFGSIVGERWWYLLQGHDIPPEKRATKTLGHSHVMAPNLRTDQGCRDVLLRLIQKASARLRSHKLCAEGMVIFVTGFERSWTVRVPLAPTSDTVTINDAFLEAWTKRDFLRPKAVGVTFFDMRDEQQVTPSLFDEAHERAELNQAVDRMNQKFGKNTIYLAGIEKTKNQAGEKIAFNKTWLFSEGKGDNEWIDTFRGVEDEEE